MTWTYTGDPGVAGSAAATAQNNLDAVRLCIGDTDTTDQLMQDAEINWFMLSQCGGTVGAVNIYRAAAYCCWKIANDFSRRADKVIGPAQLKSSQKSAQYKARGDEWFFQSRLWTGAPYAGGISISDKEAVESDTDRVEPKFATEMQTFAGVVGPMFDTTVDVVIGGT